MEAQYRPVIQDKEEQLRSIFGNSAQNEAELMTIDQCETMRELNSSHLVGAPTSTPPPPPPPPAGGDVNMVDVEVKTVASVNVADISTVKRKRGRPPKIQANTTAATAMAAATKLVDDEEDVCFICFDGGSLVLCDRRGCPKAYHPACIKRDEAFFKSKAKWNCGWHICSSCQRASHYMCYTCTYSLCKGCTRGADYVCVRGNKGFCGTCMRTIMLIEDSAQGNSAPVQVDFDDKTSWEYLFKIYWIVLKDRLSLTADEMRKAKNPWIGDEPPRPKNYLKMVANTFAPKEVQVGSGELLHGIDEKSPCLDNHNGSVEANHPMARKTKDQMEVLNEQNSLATVQPANDKIIPLPQETKWATKELLEFVSHMKNGDTSVISQFDVQALLLDYIKRNNLRDPRQKSHIVCDARLISLFGKQRVGHFEMLKLLEYHFLIKEKAPANDSVKVQAVDAVGRQIEAAVSSETQTIVGNSRRRKTRKKMDDRGAQVNLNPEEYAAIDFHNINLLYLKRNLMENLMDDADKFCEKVVGSFVRIRILGGDQKQDMYRLVQVVGTSRVAESYKVGSKTTDIMLEILNLDKKEVISIDGISNQEFSEDECQRLCQTIKCGLIKRLKVGEIREKALALQPVKVSDLLEAEISKLNHLRDRASEKGRRKDLRECVEKLDLLKSPMERQRRLLQIPDVHMDPHMDPSYRSDEDAGESDKKKQGDHIKTRDSRKSRRGSELSSPFREGVLNDVGDREQKNSASTSEQNRNVCTTSHVNSDGPIPVHERANEFKIREGEGSFGLNKHNISKNQLDSAGLANCGQDSHLVRSESPIALPGRELSPGDSETEKLWHYQDPYGNVQGPFAMMQLRKWSTSGLFPPDLRVWRVDRKQDDSVLLTDALVGRCLKESQQPCNGNILPEEAATTSNNLNKIFEHVFGQSIEESLMDDKEFDDNREPVHNNSTVNVNNVGNDLERCNGLNATSSTWTRPVDVAITSDGKAQSSLQGWELSKDGKLYETPLSQPRGKHREKWDSHPSNADDSSQRTPECQIIVRESADKQADSDGHSSQSSGQNWRSQPVDSSLSEWDPNRGCVSTAKSDKKSGQNQEVMISDLTVNQNHGELKGEAENKLSVSSNVPVQDSGPSFAPSLVVGGQLPVASEWCRYSSVPSKPTIEEWDSNIVSASSLKPTEQASDHAAMTSSGPDKLTSSLPQHTVDASSWHSLVPEPGEFCSIADESVSDLLAEVEAMESLAGLPSPTSKLSCGGELTRGPGPENECFSPIDQFGSAPDPGKSDALSSTGDVQMPSQLTAASVLLRLSLMPYQPTVADETLAASQIPSQLTTTTKPHRLPQLPPHSMVSDDQHCTSEEHLGLWQNNAHDSRKNFRGHSSSIAEVEGNAKPSDISVDQWSTHSQRQLPASSTVNQREAGSLVQSSTPTVSRLEAIPDTHHPASSRADSKSGTVKEVINLNNGAVSQGSTNMVWGSSHRSTQQQGSTTSAVSTEHHGGWGNHGRSGGDNRFSGHRDHHRDYYPNKDSGYGRDRPSSYRQQPTYGNGGGSYNKPLGKGQRVCKFYENGYCRRGASCSYWHP